MIAAALFLVERNSFQSAINNYPDALLYAISVITTGGYGDIFPATHSGRLIGLGLKILNIGFYALIIAAGIVFFSYRKFAKRS